MVSVVRSALASTSHEQPDDKHHEEQATDTAAHVRPSIIEAAATAKQEQHYQKNQHRIHRQTLPLGL